MEMVSKKKINRLHAKGNSDGHKSRKISEHNLQNNNEYEKEYGEIDKQREGVMQLFLSNKF